VVNANAANPFQYDCGGAPPYFVKATHAEFNVLVRGDSSHATVRFNVRYLAKGRECTSQGGREIDLEAEVKKRAESSATR
jgi:hypothetical protein